MNLINSCSCGKNTPVPVSALPLAIVTVPAQSWEEPYEPAAALQHGTIFPCLDLPFYVTGGGK